MNLHTIMTELTQRFQQIQISCILSIINTKILGFTDFKEEALQEIKKLTEDNGKRLAEVTQAQIRDELSRFILLNLENAINSVTTTVFTQALPLTPAGQPSKDDIQKTVKYALKKRRRSIARKQIRLITALIIGLGLFLYFVDDQSLACIDDPDMSRCMIDGVWMVRVKEGRFEMGDNSMPEFAQHVAYSASFWIDEKEVTNDQFGFATQSCLSTSAAPDEPHVCVTWAAAQDHCNERGGRLPTELEWEYAARGLDGAKYPWDDSKDVSRFDPDYAVYVETSRGRVSAVDKRPRESRSWVGAYDMAGNVWEWTLTVGSDNFKYPYNPGDGREELGDSAAYRVIRGGSFTNTQTALTTWNRQIVAADTSAPNIGFRCVIVNPK